MSRVGKTPISIPDNIKIKYIDRVITVESEKGVLTRAIHPAVDLKIEDGMIRVDVVDNNRTNRALRGLTRSLVANMVTGVTKGFERILEIHGIGYRAILNDNRIEFNIGYSHPVNFDLPEGVSATVDKKNVIRLTGIDKELMGHAAASIRRLKPPERYKGKGIKYAEERIQRKAGKTGVKEA
ncbi:MAG: 50S ribosomal protein L6 [Deltaproteobacteria bacterium]|nr:MAG: 50S ribosomal protein L6 [Deltaproteobacteria bacterium]